jgi:hypothetical protein
MLTRLKLYQTIAITCSALGLTTACFFGGGPPQPPPPDLISVSAQTLTFGAALGTASDPQTIGVINLSQQTVTLEPQAKWFPAEKNNPYAIDKTDCGLTLAPGTSCSVTLSFHPNTGSHNYFLLWLDFNRHEIHAVHLHGTVTPAPLPASK